MKWTIDLSHDAEKFLRRNHLEHKEVFELVGLAIRKLQGEVANVTVGKLKGKWAGFYRIKRGDLRIIASFDFDDLRVFVDQLDWRGNAYK